VVLPAGLAIDHARYGASLLARRTYGYVLDRQPTEYKIRIGWSIDRVIRRRTTTTTTPSPVRIVLGLRARRCCPIRPPGSPILRRSAGDSDRGEVLHTNAFPPLPCNFQTGSPSLRAHAVRMYSARAHRANVAKSKLRQSGKAYIDRDCNNLHLCINVKS
jgi:hypothetical protein